jgi:hypothetical protein
MSRTFVSSRRRPPPRVERGFEPRERSPEPLPRVEETKETTPEQQRPANEAPRRERLVEKYVEFTEECLPKRGESYDEWRWRLADEESSGLLLI